MISFNLIAQNSTIGSIQGRILDSATIEGVPYVNVIETINGDTAGTSTSDLDGFYFDKPLSQGKYTLKFFDFYGYYYDKTITEINVYGDKITFRDVFLSPKRIHIEN